MSQWARKQTEKIEEKPVQPELRLLKIQCEKDLQKLRFKDSYGYCCDKNRQYEDNELLGDNTCGTGRWALADVSGQWPGKHGVI